MEKTEIFINLKFLKKIGCIIHCNYFKALGSLYDVLRSKYFSLQLEYIENNINETE